MDKANSQALGIKGEQIKFKKLQIVLQRHKLKPQKDERHNNQIRNIDDDEEMRVI